MSEESGRAGEFATGWRIIREFIDFADASHAAMLQKLVRGGIAVARIDPNLSFLELDSDHSPAKLLSLLFSTGYVTEVGKTEDGRSMLKIPNEEIRSCFRDQILAWFTSDSPAYVSEAKEIWDALNKGFAPTVEQKLEHLLLLFMSVRDGASEAFYHGFLLSLLGIAGEKGNARTVRSNREVGHGYADIIIDDWEQKKRIVIELKKAESDALLDQACRDAIAQIDERRYGDGGLDAPQDFKRCGIAFHGKKCRVKMA